MVARAKRLSATPPRPTATRRELAAEIATHQSRLEAKNRELRRAQAELERSRARYFALFDLSPVAYVVVDKRLEIVEANLAASRLFHIDRAKLKGEALLTLVPESERGRWAEHFAACFKRERAPRLDSQLTARSGETWAVHLASRLLAVEEGGPGVALTAMLDMTERVKAEDEREKLRGRLMEKQKVESLGVLAGGIAHDFNNLLAGIVGSASLLKDRAAGQPALGELADYICGSGQRAAELCRLLVAYAGRTDLRKGPVNLNRVVSDALELLRPGLPTGIRVRFDPELELPEARGEPTQLQQVVLNLAVNASEALGGGDGQIEIRTGVEAIDPAAMTGLATGVEEPAGKYAFVRVTDTGCGMAPDTLGKIFDPFFTTKFDGRGLGLAAVLGIVRSHRGVLGVKSQAGQGSVFTFWLAI